LKDNNERFPQRIPSKNFQTPSLSGKEIG